MSMTHKIIFKTGEDDPDRTLVFMCPECFSRKEIRDIEASISIKSESGICPVTPSSLREIVRNSFCLYCDDCGNEMVEVDADIAATIIEFNRKGYKTLACCSGHFYGNKLEDADAYIMFGADPFTTAFNKSDESKIRKALLVQRSYIHRNLISTLNQRTAGYHQGDLDEIRKYIKIGLVDIVNDDPRVEFRVNIPRLYEDMGNMKSTDFELKAIQVVKTFRKLAADVAATIPPIDIDTSTNNRETDEWLVPYISGIRNQDYNKKD